MEMCGGGDTRARKLGGQSWRKEEGEGGECPEESRAQGRGWPQKEKGHPPLKPLEEVRSSELGGFVL